MSRPEFFLRRFSAGGSDFEPPGAGGDPRMAILADVLRPAPLSPQLRGRVLADLQRRTRRNPPGGWRAGGLAAAAAIGLIAVLPRGMPGGARPDGDGSVVLTPEDTRELLATYAAINLDGAADPTIQDLQRSVESLEKTVESTTGGELLPWGADDDWDRPSDGKKRTAI